MYPSLISADLLNLEKTVRALEPYCAGFHVDVMDNHFVPNLTLGPLFVEALERLVVNPLWVHLMVENPLAMIEKIRLRPKTTLSFHFESTKEIKNMALRIKEKKWRASLAISPKTMPEEIFPFLPMLDQVLVMSVNPGFSGQQFLPDSLVKVSALVEYRHKHDLSYTIAMDGGINKGNIAALAHAGVQEVAVASAIFGAADPVRALQELHALASKK